MDHIVVDAGIAARFWTKVHRGPSCWIWTGAMSGEYGSFRLGGRSEPAHRVAYMLQRGPIPEGQMVLHDCDNPPCMRGSHLFLGDHKANAQDAIGKGRWITRDVLLNRPRGAAHHNGGKTHCAYGHPYTPANTYRQGPSRACRTCALRRARESKERRREPAP